MTRHLGSVDFGPTRIVDTGKIEHIPHGQTSKRRTSSGTSHIYLILGSPGLSVRAAFIEWDNGDREVRGLPGSTPHHLFSRLVKGGRVSIMRHGIEEWMELRISMITAVEPRLVWSNPRKTDLDGLNDECGFDVKNALSDIGAHGVGTLEELIGTENRRRTDLCVLFEANERIVPLAAFAAVRVISISRQGANVGLGLPLD